MNVKQFHVCIKVISVEKLFEISRSYDFNTLSANCGNFVSVMQDNRSHFCKKLFDNAYEWILLTLTSMF